MFDASILLSITVFCIGSLVLNSLLGLGEVMIREGQVERGVTILFFCGCQPNYALPLPGDGRAKS